MSPPAPSPSDSSSRGVPEFPPAPTPPARVPLGVLLAYGPPLSALGLCLFFISFYFLKFATDTLLIEPAVVGFLFGLSRIWDAVTDPIVGSWSDRTRTRLGRRRPWMLAALPVIAVTTVFLWSPPETLTGPPLVLWTAFGLFGFYTGLTMYYVPHQGLGAELTLDHHERSRIFGMRHAAWMLSMMVAFGVMGVVDGADDTRGAARQAAVAIALVAVAVLAVPVLRVSERRENWGRGGHSPIRAMRDVLGNPHARRLMVVWFIESMGGGVLGVLAPYVTEYVTGRPDLIAYLPACFFVAAIGSIPGWVLLSRRFGKRNVWVFAMLGVGFAFGGTFFLAPENLVGLFVLLTIAGTCSGCGGAIGQSILADVIDFDEVRSGERKEGAYSAAFGFALKSGIGLIVIVTGFALQLSGFEPNVQQSDTALLTLRGLFAGVPFVAFVSGALIFRGFRFNEREHAEVRAVLQGRSAGGPSARSQAGEGPGS